jgi:hypothetical protein
MRIRRLAAGELAGDERARTEEHLAACRRCQAVERELGEERARVLAELPFEALAAGVAERLARAPGRAAAPGARRWRAVGLALAAGVAFAVAAPAALRVAREAREGGADPSTGSAWTGVKGGPVLTVWVREAGGARALAPGEPIPERAALRVGLSPAGRAFAAVALVDRDGAAVLHAGPAEDGVLPGAFEWTGAGEGTLVVVLDDAAIDGAALADRLARGGPAAAAPHPGAEVLLRPLRRGPR